MLRRAGLSAFLFAAAFLALVGAGVPPSATGADKDKDGKKDAKKDSAQEIALRRELAEAKQQINALQADNRAGQARVNALEAQLKREAKGDVADAKTIQGLTAQLAALRGATYLHATGWKKKSDAPDSAVQSFLDDVQGTLGGVKSVRWAWAGKPPTATSETDVVLVLVFDDATAFKQHKADPLTKKFHDKHDKDFNDPKPLEFIAIPPK